MSVHRCIKGRADSLRSSLTFPLPSQLPLPQSTATNKSQPHLKSICTRYQSIATTTKQNKTPSSKMQFTTVAAIFFAGLAAAVPTAEVHERGDYTACTGLYGTSQCCATDVLGVADLDCANPPEVPISADNFSEVCSAIGQRARCCVLPILGQDVLCQTPVGVDS